MTNGFFAAAIYSAAFIAAFGGSVAHAIDGYWRGDISNDWNDGIVEQQQQSNWYSQAGGAGSLRNVPDNTARFAAGANETTLVIRRQTRIIKMVFEAGTPLYVFRISDAKFIIGGGIANQSSKTPVIRVDGAHASMVLEGIAEITSVSPSVPAAEIITSNRGRVFFDGSSRGGNTRVSNTGNGVVLFRGDSSAEQMKINNQAGEIAFRGRATGGQAQIINAADGDFYCELGSPFTLAIGRFSNDGLLDLGPCNLQVADSYTQRLGAVLFLEIPTPNRFGRVVTTGDAAVGGLLEVHIAPTVAVPRTFTIVRAGGRRTGSFVSVNITGRNDVKGRLAYSSREVRLIVEKK